MLSFQILVLFFSVSIFAIIPVGEDRFISTKSYKVSSVQLPPQGFENYLQLLKASPQSKGLNIQKDSDNNNNGSSNSTVLNLKPGITTLQTDENNECYFVNTTIGKKEFPLIIDTGSAYLWVYGDNCTDSACQNNALYTPASSESSTSTFALAYVTGTASGQVVEDNIIVNKLATTQKFKFGKADKVPDFFKNYPVSGIFGLPSNDSSAIQSIISALYDSHAISIEKFSISLGNISNSTDYPNSGIFAIGDPIKELYKGDIHYSDLIENDSHYWLIPIESVTLDSFDVNFTNPVNLGDGQANSSTSRKAIVDSGTTVLALPKQDALDLHSYFTNSITDGTNFAILCNSSFNIGLNINGHDWTIEPENYLGAKYSDPSMAGYCVSNIQGIDSAAADSWILGAAFLKSVYAVFDVNNQQIGFATKNEDVVLTSTSTSPSSSAIQTSSAAYYGNSSSIMTSLSSNSSASTSASKTSHKAAGVALTSTHYFSIYSIIISFITTFLL